MVRILATIILLVAGAAGAAAEDNPIVARMQAFAAAYNAKDADAIVTFYTDDAAVLPPGAAIVSGPEAINNHYASAFRLGASNLRFRILEIRQVGPATVIEIGETLVSAGKDEIKGRYMHVWIVQDGTWLLARDMYHVIGLAK